MGETLSGADVHPARTLARGATSIVCVASAALALTLAAGCGDGPICQSESLVIIRSPQGPIVADNDLVADGIQADVEVATTFPRDAVLALTVHDAEDELLAMLTARTDANGNATFFDVTMPETGGTLRVSGDAGVCGQDDDEVTVAIVGGGDCELSFATPPVANDHYAPLPVFNLSTDEVPGTPGHQGDVVVQARPGEQAKLFQASPGQLETEIAAATVGDDGQVRLATNLPEGQVNLRAECGAASAIGGRSSGVVSVMVDTVAPTCTLVAPTPGTSITPSLDADADLDNGVQLTLTGNASGGDTEGEAATFTLVAPGGGTTALIGTDLDAAGDSTADASFDPATTPADFAVRFATEDHAGNPCTADEPYRVVYDGCAIAVVMPTGTVTTDADADSTNGAQIDVVLDVDDACAGRTITSDCGSDDPGATVGATGAATLRPTVCTDVPCESNETCTVRVTSPDGIETTAGVVLDFDNLAPNVAVAVAQPLGVACGAIITPAQDADPTATGVQLRMRVTAPGAASRQLRLTNASGTTTVPVTAPSGEQLATIDVGANTFVGLATDGAGNTGTSAPCTVSLADIAINFTGPAADGMVGGADGTVAAGSLTFALTGTVSTTGATVTVTVDGGPAQPAVVTGTTFSITLTLADRALPYNIVATATQGPRVGTASLALTVDLTPPPAPIGLAAVADTRQSIRMNFTAPPGASSYRIKVATVALTEANFDTAGTTVAAPTPGPSGSAQVARALQLRTGTPHWVGIASVDGSGNRSLAQIAGPLTPTFDRATPVLAPSTAGSTASFGLAMVRGRFNDDAFDDVAVGAPFVDAAGLGASGEVYVYLGSATGLATTPALTIQGTANGQTLGSSLAAVRWSSTTRHDLAIGAPGSDSIFILNGGAALPTGTVSASVAQRRIGVSTAVNWFTGSGLGWQLATADHDGDGTDDLAASALFGAGGLSGAAVVFYGGTVPVGNPRISDLSAAGSGTLVARMYEDPDATGSFFGYYLHGVGPTGGPADATGDLVVAYAEDGIAGGNVILYRGQGRPPMPGVTREPFTAGRDVRLRFNTIDQQLEWGSAVGSISDQNGDGARDLVLADFRDRGDAGVAFIVDGDTVGTAGIAALDAPGVTLTTLFGVQSNEHFGMAIVNNAQTADPDVDGDGVEDLIIAARRPGTTQAVLDVWFGPIAPGTQNPAAPQHVIDGPAGFAGTQSTNGGTPITAIWAGDVNADGLDDVCWADWTSNGLDGSLQLLWDDGS